MDRLLRLGSGVPGKLPFFKLLKNFIQTYQHTGLSQVPSPTADAPVDTVEQVHDFIETIENITMENDRMRTQNLCYRKMVYDKKAQLKDLQKKQLQVVAELKDHDDKYDKIKRIRLEKEMLLNDEIK